jgi:hypothetical protein
MTRARVTSSERPASRAAWARARLPRGRRLFGSAAAERILYPDSGVVLAVAEIL